MASKTLQECLAQTMGEVGYVQKDATNDFQRYRYASAEAVLKKGAELVMTQAGENAAVLDAAFERKQNRSLLSAGIKQAEGKFDRGDIVDIFDTEGTHLGCGITNYSSSDIGIIKGAQSRKIADLLNVDYGPEVVHRNNLAVF